MKRTHFLKNLTGLGLLSAIGCRLTNENTEEVSGQEKSNFSKTERAIDQLREELLAAWYQSEKMTLTNVEQMPEAYFTFKYTEEAMTFSEQWRHCVIYTCGQLAGRAEIKNPYENVKLPVQMPKKDIIKELKNMYNHVRKSISELPEEKLNADCEFAGETIPVWRLFYAMENHIIHHRGQCVVYLRLKGVTPKGYYGW
ncbi:DinB family protein [Croceivirga thetidis]|uniref:DinB family protein n=1 Tax=Croceivirga thetidis TaxID=2721623 RepID=A0ABX1GT14_9FLAO|nr:DinB family protein [Croceivirga thetidis]NKI32186.1 DinB family protein [Croceivirga thetidis]